MQGNYAISRNLRIFTGKFAAQRCFLIGAILLAGCNKTPLPSPVVRTVTLAAGTPLKLILLDELTSGGSEKGSSVRLALSEPIEGLPLLSPVTATVSQSRTEGTLGALMNKPARLAIDLGNLTGPSGEAIPLSAEPSEPKEFELNRANTGRPESPDSGDPTSDGTENAVKELIERGQTNGLNAEQVGALARKLSMGETAKLADAGRLGDAQRLIRAVRDGGSIAGLATGGTVAAAMELINLAGDVGHRVGKSLGGRNIRAYPGTMIPAYIARDTPIVLSP